MALGDLTIMLPLSRRVELQLWVPILEMALARSLVHDSIVWSDLFLRIFLRGDDGGLFVAPGIGFWHFFDAGASIYELPFRVGWEFPTTSRRFGLSVAARTWIDVIVAKGGETGVGVGGVLELGFTFYLIR